MFRIVATSLLAAFLLASGSTRPPVVKVCPGFLPENDLRIPVSKSAKGIQEAQFHAVLDTVDKIYRPIVAARGGTLLIERNWEDETVNAYAQRQGTTYKISMFGGLARHPAVTQDGFALVACHEMSHHLGGAPKSSGWFSSWATIEGQADYAANLKCLRRVFADASARTFSRPPADDPAATAACDKAFSSPRANEICLRATRAGLSVTALFKALVNDEKDYRYDTPDPTVVTEMYEKHPKTQCRLDTYLQGSLCAKPVSEGVSDRDVLPGTCNASAGYTVGTRPLCWYKPPTPAAPDLGSPASVSRATKRLSSPDSALSALGRDTWAGL